MDTYQIVCLDGDGSGCPSQVRENIESGVKHEKESEADEYVPERKETNTEAASDRRPEYQMLDRA